MILEILKAAEFAICQLLNRLIRRKALRHLLQQLLQTGQRLRNIDISGRRASGNNGAKIQRRQIVHGMAAPQRAAPDSGQQLCSAGRFVQTQPGQELLRRESILGNSFHEPFRERFRSVCGTRTRCEKQRYTASYGAAYDPPKVLLQLLQLLLKSGPVSRSIFAGLLGQLLHAAEAVLYLGQHGLACLEHPAALPDGGR